jgi:hypothetical protein
MIYKAGGETLVFNKYLWLEYGNALKKLELKKEKDMLKNGREVMKEWEKTKGKKI